MVQFTIPIQNLTLLFLRFEFLACQLCCNGSVFLRSCSLAKELVISAKRSFFTLVVEIADSFLAKELYYSQRVESFSLVLGGKILNIIYSFCPTKDLKITAWQDLLQVHSIIDLIFSKQFSYYSSTPQLFWSKAKVILIFSILSLFEELSINKVESVDKILHSDPWNINKVESVDKVLHFYPYLESIDEVESVDKVLHSDYYLGSVVILI
ncbi:hypothetical protein M9H77_33601 [Catharanthus roseus]|uniref:Uncharacterized protein n=1 Tax=Catharanthus roseus TaxID=4058 RepID=A0ACB9ZK12_CATRO|nr:hypothetical protein M9H77_33601 [Catharanthus roseus]